MVSSRAVVLGTLILQPAPIMRNFILTRWEKSAFALLKGEKSAVTTSKRRL